MSGFVAIILICQMSLPSDACTEASARDVMSIRVDNEIGCTIGWQDVVARSPLADDIGKGSYIKTLCRRGESAPGQATAPQ
jgi:hypothetical protein